MADHQSRKYRENTWEGIPHYECAAPGCPFDTFDEALMQEHVEHPTAQEMHRHIEASLRARAGKKE